MNILASFTTFVFFFFVVQSVNFVIFLIHIKWLLAKKTSANIMEKNDFENWRKRYNTGNSIKAKVRHNSQ